MEETFTQQKNKKAVILAILAALLYGISTPVSKVLLTKISPTLMAALLYLGAGLGMVVVNIFRVNHKNGSQEAKITKKEMPFVLGMILLDIIAPIMLMIGLTMTPAGNVSLLNNFEIVATAFIAMIFFKEMIGKRMWVAIIFIVLGSFFLSIEEIRNFTFSFGAILVLLATISWGLENNCTRMLSLKDPLQVVVIKGIGSGLGALFVTVYIRAFSFDWIYVFITLCLGGLAYGLSIYLYIYAQRDLGAARTSAYYSAAPFIGVLSSWVFLREVPSLTFFIALTFMIIGTYFMITENHQHIHAHKELAHEHKHSHEDGHHIHTHTEKVVGEHTHYHVHGSVKHEHSHTPDLHHTHAHE